MRLLNQYISRFLGAIFWPFARIWSFMRRVIPGLKKLPSLKPEVLAALLSFLFVLTVVVVHFFIVFVFTPDEESRSSYWGTAGILILLLFVIPVVVYVFFRILLAPPKSPFPEIDLAFEAGLGALQKNGISIKESPLYLVLGMPDARKIKQMMATSGRTFDFAHVTADGQALYWYGSTESTYLFLSGVGNVCQLTKDHAKHDRETSASSDEYAAADDHRGTIDVRQLAKQKQGSQAFADDDIEPAGDAIKATIKASELKSKRQEPVREEPVPTIRTTKQLSSREKLAVQKRRIGHVCRLLARRRRPVSSINGIIVSMSHGLIEDFPGEFARQIKSDLTAICQTTGVICTVTAIVQGLENNQGCREFVARLREIKGEDFLNRRFGKSYRSWECPTPDHLEEISHESIENFDQYIYSIFTQHDGLSARHVNGNRDMVKFLCWIYSRFFQGLELTLSTGFNAEVGGSDDFPRFAGCYFIGIGDSPDYQFFCEGIFDRVDENQGELEWNSKVLRREESWTLMSQLVFLLGLIAIAIFIYFIVLHSRSESSTTGAKSTESQAETGENGWRLPTSYRLKLAKRSKN